MISTPLTPRADDQGIGSSYLGPRLLNGVCLDSELSACAPYFWVCAIYFGPHVSLCLSDFFDAAHGLGVDGTNAKISF